jgi:hypothetical protein
MDRSDLASPTTLYAPATDAGGAGRAAGHKWPLRRTLLFVVAVSIALWAVIIFAVWRLL